MTGPQETGIGEDQLRRQQTFAEQRLRAVQVGQDPLQQAGPLDQAGSMELASAEEMSSGNGVELPGPVHAPRVAVDVVGDAVLADELTGLFPAAGQLGQAERVQGLEGGPASAAAPPRRRSFHHRGRPGRCTRVEGPRSVRAPSGSTLLRRPPRPARGVRPRMDCKRWRRFGVRGVCVTAGRTGMRDRLTGRLMTRPASGP